MAAGHQLGAARNAHGFHHRLDVRWRFLGNLVHQEGHDKVHQRANRTEGFGRDAKEAVGAANQIQVFSPLDEEQAQP